MNARKFRPNLTVAVASLLALACSPQAFACAACFGKSDSNLAKGMNYGIFALLLVITMVLGGVASFFLYLARRGAAMEHDSSEGMEPVVSETATKI
jgi:hypothetical protein